MENNIKENENSPNKILNGSEIQFYQNINDNSNNNISSQEYLSTVPSQNNINKNPKKNNQKLIRPELDFLKITKIKLKTIKEIIITKFDKAFKELSNNIKNKKISLASDKLKIIENARWKLIEEINDLEILNKEFEKKFNNIIKNKTTRRNHSHINIQNTNKNSVNISGVSNPKKRNSFSDVILPTSPINNNSNTKKIIPSLNTIKTPKLNDNKKKSKIPYMNRSKSGTKINLNKSLNNKSFKEIKLSSNNNKTNCTLQDYIKNKNSLILSNSNTEESLCENYIINSYKIKIEEKEKELNYIKEKLENERILNKNLLHELDKVKYNKSIQNTRNQFNQILNKSNSKNDELIIISNKLTKLIEMVINFSYSMATLRGNVFAREKMKKNESIKAYETLNNDLKQIYNEFVIINKSLKNASGVNIKPNESKQKNNIQTKNNNIITISNNIENKEIINAHPNIINNDFVNNSNYKNVEKRNQAYNSSNKYKEININSPIKEENSLEITNEEKVNLDEIKKNLNDYTIKMQNKEDKNIINQKENFNYKQINIIQNKNRHRKDENEDNDFEKSKRTNLSFFIHTNSDKIFTFRNNSSISNKEGDKLTEKSGGPDAGKSFPPDINKIIEENHNLKMQLASEMLKNNGVSNAENSESHNDEEYEEIISGLKKKLEDKENKINELQKIIDSDKANTSNSFKIKNDKMNNSMNEMEKIKGNYQENISTITDIYENMIIEKDNKIKELTNEVNIIEKDLEELTDKYEKEKENKKMNILKINELEEEKRTLLEQINTFRNKEKELKLNYEKNLETLKNENNKLKEQLNENVKNYINNFSNDNINNDNNFNSASNRQITKQKEELLLLKKKFKEILADNNKLTNEVNDYNLNQTKEKEEFIDMMRNTFTKFLKASKIDNKNKDYAIIVLKLLGFSENDIKDIFKSQKKGIFGIFQ